MAEPISSMQRIELALGLLPPGLRPAFEALAPAEKCVAEELRLRVGFPPCVLLPSGERELGARTVARQDLDAALELATGASVHTARDTLRQGYVTARGGFRIGLAGSVVLKNGEPSGFRELSSLTVRIPREMRGVAARLVPALMRGGLKNTLVVSPPGAGKTTLLRDLVRVISDGSAADDVRSRRVGLADERGEIAALHGGQAQLYVGRHTDILDNCPKAEAVLMLLRVMNPEVVALDELTSPADAAALLRASHCGAGLVATAHAENLADLHKKPLYRELLGHGIFEYAVTIANQNGARLYNAEALT